MNKKHPRVCGEDFIVDTYNRIKPETPPRMRGRPSEKYGRQIVARNTPAYAGKTNPNLFFNTLDRKHPRVCGEDQQNRIMCNKS